uniref:Uncharacterized protein n=1 Tax=Glossina austeni TaxID=7395 RepID=A0A1A9VP77_GLOAU
MIDDLASDNLAKLVGEAPMHIKMGVLSLQFLRQLIIVLLPIDDYVSRICYFSFSKRKEENFHVRRLLSGCLTLQSLQKTLFAWIVTAKYDSSGNKNYVASHMLSKEDGNNMKFERLWKIAEFDTNATQMIPKGQECDTFL